MLRINDCRSKNEYKLKDIEKNAFFLFNGLLCRRVFYNDEVEVRSTWDNGDIVIMEMPSGILSVLDRETYVELIPDDQVTLYVE